jgi:hypothetical protein
LIQCTLNIISKFPILLFNEGDSIFQKRKEGSSVAAQTENIIQTILLNELEVFEVKIRGKRYFATNTTNGDIYARDADGEVGDKIGQFVNGEARL